jgi:hypothetical protein
MEALPPESGAKRRDWGLIVWLLFAFFTVIVGTVLTTAWAVRHAIFEGPFLPPGPRDAVIAVAKFPRMVLDAVQQLKEAIEGTPPAALLVDRKTVERPHRVRRFPAPEDTGYLLLSGVDPKTRQSSVRLIRIADGAELARWDPDWREINRRMSSKKFAPLGNPASLRAIHPILLDDGDIVFNTYSSLVRVNRCSAQPLWVLDEMLHHSNELGPDGSIWTPGLSTEGYADNEWLRERMRDDSLTRLSADGRRLETRSMARILRNNGLEALLLGTGGSTLQRDPVHLNQITVARQDTAHWNKGDLLLSARHMSAVFLYRPSTDKILWYRMGPWLNQHSADFVGDSRISVFDNNVYGGAPRTQPFVVDGNINRVFVFDFATGELTQPFASLLEQARPVTMFEGRARILPDGGLFVEESDMGRHLRFTKDRLLWSRVNDYDASRIGVVAWSRYLTAEEAETPLRALAARPCTK